MSLADFLKHEFNPRNDFKHLDEYYNSIDRNEEITPFTALSSDLKNVLLPQIPIMAKSFVRGAVIGTSIGGIINLYNLISEPNNASYENFYAINMVSAYIGLTIDSMQNYLRFMLHPARRFGKTANYRLK